MLVPLGADGCLVFVGCDLYMTGGGTTVRIVLHFLIFDFISLALLWGGQRYPPVLLYNVMYAIMGDTTREVLCTLCF
jgi:hypothetical protein